MAGSWFFLAYFHRQRMFVLSAQQRVACSADSILRFVTRASNVSSAQALAAHMPLTTARVEADVCNLCPAGIRHWNTNPERPHPTSRRTVSRRWIPTTFAPSA